MSFTPFDFAPAIVSNLATAGFSTPTPIQNQAIGPILAGRDVMGLAQTGTGKTAAYALPVLQRLLQGPRRRVRALVVAPTRELADQIFEVFMQLGRGTGLRYTTLYGGVSLVPQTARLRDRPEVIVACPGRLLDHLNRGHLRLDTAEMVILDEADRMFDMGFLPDIRKILARTPSSRQTLLFSATMPPDIRRLANEVLHDPQTVQIAPAVPPETVSHALFPVAPSHKTALLLHLLGQIDRDSVLVFTRTKHRADKLARDLAAAGHAVAALQGGLTQARRKAAMAGFRNGTYRLLVATDIAARGLDVSTISHVINFDMPATVDDYIHRIGRTGRAAKSGDAFTLVTREDEGLVRAIENRLGVRLVRRVADGFVQPATGARGAPRPRPASVEPRLDGTPRRPPTRGRWTQRRFGGRRGPGRPAPGTNPKRTGA